MNVDGRFSELAVTDNTDDVTIIEDVRFIQDGFSFTAFVDFDHYPLIDVGYTVVGYIDDNAVARGAIQKISPVERDGSEYIRLSVSPNTHPERGYTLI